MRQLNIDAESNVCLEGRIVKAIKVGFPVHIELPSQVEPTLRRRAYFEIRLRDREPAMANAYLIVEQMGKADIIYKVQFYRIDPLDKPNHTIAK